MTNETRFQSENLNRRDHLWHTDIDKRTILKQTLKKWGVREQNGDIRLKLEVLRWALQNTTMNIYIPQYTTEPSATNTQHHRRVSNILTEQAANAHNSYVATVTTFTKQYSSSQQEAVTEVCMTVMHSKLKRSWKATKHTYTTKLATACFLSNMFHHFVRSPTRKNV